MSSGLVVRYTFTPDFWTAYGWAAKDGDNGIGGCTGDHYGWTGRHPISEQLHTELLRRQAQYAYAPGTTHGWPCLSQTEWASFNALGVALTRRVKLEIGDEARVFYLKAPEDPSCGEPSRFELLVDGTAVPAPGPWDEHPPTRDARVPPPPTPELAEAYRQTTYAVGGNPGIALRLDTPVPGLVEWLTAHGAQQAVVITAFNPFSEACSQEDNESRNGELLANIRDRGLAFVEAMGQGADDAWPPEASYCVFDAPLPVIDAWMRRLGQYAVVVADPVKGCSLLWHPGVRQQQEAS